MDRRGLGVEADSRASRLILGGPFAERPYEVSREIVATFAAAGGRLVETAAAYATGEAEKEVGRLLRDAPHLRVITKIGMQLPTGDPAVDLLEQARYSAQRLGRPADVLLLHRDFAEYQADDLMGPLLEARSLGLARHVGVTNWTGGRIGQLSDPESLNAVSAQLSLAVPREPLWPGTVVADQELIAIARTHALPLLAWSANARGWFAEPQADDFSPELTRLRGVFDTELNRELRRLAEETARELSTTTIGLALAWLLARYEQVLPIIGPWSVDELRQSLAAITLDLPATSVSQLTRFRENGVPK